MVCLQMCALANPDLVHFPLWAWLTLMIGVGLLVASISVHMELRTKIRRLEAVLNGPPPHHLQHTLMDQFFHHPHHKTWSAKS